MNDNKLKISNPQRVARILRRICQANLQVMVRGLGNSGIAVKGRALGMISSKQGQAMKIGNISEKGLTHLTGHNRVQVEFIMMSTKVVFVSVILRSDSGSLVVALPSSLVSIERRKNARYQTSDNVRSFMDFSVWQPHADDPISPPYLPHYRTLGGLISVADFSFGGFCAHTTFPAVNSVLRKGLIDDRAKIYFPMREPIEVGIEVRWIKRINEVTADGHQSRSMRFGIELISQSEKARSSIRQFLHQLSQADAI